MRNRIINKKIFVEKKKVNKKLEKVEWVCIDRPVGGIGDVLMATVAMREFKRENPKVKLLLQ